MSPPEPLVQRCGAAKRARSSTKMPNRRLHRHPAKHDGDQNRGNCRASRSALTSLVLRQSESLRVLQEAQLVAVCAFGGAFPTTLTNPATTAKPMKIPTAVPPRTAPAKEERINSIPGIRLLEFIPMAPKMIVKKEKPNPPQPRPITVSAPSARRAPPIPPTNKVTMAATTANTPAMRAISPPAFLIAISPVLPF